MGANGLYGSDKDMGTSSRQQSQGSGGREMVLDEQEAQGERLDLHPGRRWGILLPCIPGCTSQHLTSVCTHTRLVPTGGLGLQQAVGIPKERLLLDMG